MPRKPTRPPSKVSRITVDVVRAAHANPPEGKSTFYYYVTDEAYKVQLRVLRHQVQIGIRYNGGKSWESVGKVPADVGIQELEDLRLAARKKRRDIEDEDEEPALANGRLLTVAQLRAQHREWYMAHRRDGKSARTPAWYDDIWSRLDAAIGHLRLREVTEPVAAGLKIRIRDAVRADRAHADGSHTANHCLAYAQTLFDFARSRGYLVRNPFAQVEPWDLPSAEVHLEDADLRAIGQALRNLELQAADASAQSRHVPSLAALAAIRVTLYTGCRHREELCRGELSWLRDTAGPIPRLEIPRAKGDRGDRRGRFLYLGPHAVRLLLAIPRPSGAEQLLVPGRLAGKPLFRLNEAWSRVLREAALLVKEGEASTIRKHARADGEVPGIPVKATRHTARTNMVRAGIPEEHAGQLLGHKGASITNRVYLQQHGPSLVEAAAKLETFTRRLMGEGREEAGVLEFRRERGA